MFFIAFAKACWRTTPRPESADLTGGMVDVAIRHGSGKYPGLHAERLFAPRLVVVASPSVLLDGPLTDPADCLRYPLLLDRDRSDWPAWLEGQGIGPTRNARAGPSYADDALLLQAAAAGQGLAVVRDVYAARALRRAVSRWRVKGRCRHRRAIFFVVVHPDRLAVPKIATLGQWIMEEAGVPSSES